MQINLITHPLLLSLRYHSKKEEKKEGFFIKITKILRLFY